MDTTNETITLQWTAGDGSEETFWVSCGSMDAVSIGVNTTYIASRLESNTLYRCEVYGENFIGKGEAESVENFTNRKMFVYCYSCSCYCLKILIPCCKYIIVGFFISVSTCILERVFFHLEGMCSDHK